MHWNYDKTLNRHTACFGTFKLEVQYEDEVGEWGQWYFKVTKVVNESWDEFVANGYAESLEGAKLRAQEWVGKVLGECTVE